MHNRELGRLGEEIASKYILDHGYVILQKNYRTKIGEIDIVARDGNYIVFIEVKARRSTSFGFPREAVDKNKQAKIKDVAVFYLQQNKKHNFHIRFDVVEVMLDYNNILKSVILLRNAF